MRLNNHTSVIAEFNDEETPFINLNDENIFDTIKKRYRDGSSTSPTAHARGRLSKILISDSSETNDKYLKILEDKKENPISWQYIVENLKIFDQIGEGSFGKVYHCVLDIGDSLQKSHLECSVKFSKLMIEQSVITIEDVTPSKIIFDPLVTKRGRAVNKLKNDYFESVQNFKTEYDNAIHITEPWRENKDLFTERKTLKPLKRENVHAIRQEMLRYKHHEGYIHMHKILHFDPTLCILISEKCLDDMHSCVEYYFNDKLRTEFRERDIQNFNVDYGTDMGIDFIQYTTQQLGWGMKYLVEEIGISHMDLKPENIFFVIDPSQPCRNIQYKNLDDYHRSVVWKYGDFGSVVSCDHEREQKVEGFTSMYLPKQIDQMLTDIPSGFLRFDSVKCMIWGIVYIILELLSTKTFDLQNPISISCINPNVDVPMNDYVKNWANKRIFTHRVFENNLFFTIMRNLVKKLVELDIPVETRAPKNYDRYFFLSRNHGQSIPVFEMFEQWIATSDTAFNLDKFMGRSRSPVREISYPASPNDVKKSAVSNSPVYSRYSMSPQAGSSPKLAFSPQEFATVQAHGDDYVDISQRVVFPFSDSSMSLPVSGWHTISQESSNSDMQRDESDDNFIDLKTPRPIYSPIDHDLLNSIDSPKSRRQSIRTRDFIAPGGVVAGEYGFPDDSSSKDIYHSLENLLNPEYDKYGLLTIQQEFGIPTLDDADVVYKASLISQRKRENTTSNDSLISPNASVAVPIVPASVAVPIVPASTAVPTLSASAAVPIVKDSYASSLFQTRKNIIEGLNKRKRSSQNHSSHVSMNRDALNPVPSVYAPESYASVTTADRERLREKVLKKQSSSELNKIGSNSITASNHDENDEDDLPSFESGRHLLDGLDSAMSVGHSQEAGYGGNTVENQHAYGGHGSLGRASRFDSAQKTMDFETAENQHASGGHGSLRQASMIDSARNKMDSETAENPDDFDPHAFLARMSRIDFPYHHFKVLGDYMPLRSIPYTENHSFRTQDDGRAKETEPVKQKEVEQQEEPIRKGMWPRSRQWHRANPPPSIKQQYAKSSEKPVSKKSKNFTVDEILGRRYNPDKKRMEYLVSWEGYGPEHNLHIPIENFVDESMVEAYNKKHPMFFLHNPTTGEKDFP